MSRKPTFNSYLDELMSESWAEVKQEFSYGSGKGKFKSTAKFLGKGTLFLGVKAIQNLPRALEAVKKQQDRERERLAKERANR